MTPGSGGGVRNWAVSNLASAMVAAAAGGELHVWMDGLSKGWISAFDKLKMDSWALLCPWMLLG